MHIFKDNNLKTHLYKNLKYILIVFVFFNFQQCGIYKKTNSRDISTNANERARKAVQEGRGVGIGSILKGRGTNYEFSSSNPMWRASLEILDFLPLTVVDYSGGMLITDWYNDEANSNNSLKITLRFLSNEIRSDSIKIIVHEKKCKQNNCTVRILDSRIQEELLTSIIKKAAILDRESKKK